MKPDPFTAASLGAAAFLGLLFLGPPPARAQSPTDAKTTVGIFSRAMIVQVYYRSPAWSAKVRAMAEERNKAAAAGDDAKIDQIERQLRGLQELAQKQLAGEVPPTNIYDLLKAEWPAIAKEAGVDLIVDTPIYQAGSARVVDVTPFIVKRLTAKKE
jgi:hypothetical protein